MKKTLAKLVKNEQKRYQQLLVSNTLSPEDKTAVSEHLTELGNILAEVEAAEEEGTALDTLKKMIEATEEKIKAIAEKIEEQPAAPVANALGDYLKSEGAKRDFGRVIRNSILRHTDFNEDWRSHLEGKKFENAITLTNGEYGTLYPEVVKSRIHDLWNADTNWLTMLHNTNAKVYGVRYTSQSQDSTDVRAKGHQKGATKTAQSVTIDSFKIEAQMVYKMIPIDRITEFYDDGALVDFVVDELFRQFKYEVARCVLVGDGRLGTDPDRITSFSPVGRTTTDAFVTVAGRNSSVTLVEDLVALSENIGNKEENDIILVISENDLNILRRRVYGSGGTVQYASREEVAEQLGVARIVTSPLVGSANTYTYQAIMFAPALYATVGDVLNPKYETFHDFFTNQDYHRMEFPIGGAPEGLKMGAVLTPIP